MTLDLRQTAEYALFLKKEGWLTVKLRGNYYYLKKIPLLGYILKVQRVSRISFEDIDTLCQKYGIFLIILEPDSISAAADGRSTNFHSFIVSQGFKVSKQPYLPTKSLKIDLTQSNKNIRKSFKRNIRKGLRLGEGLKIEEYSTPKEILFFHSEWKNIIKNQRYVPSVETLINLKESFPQNKSLFLASHNISGRIIGGVIFTTVSHEVSNYIKYDSVNYLYGFSSFEGRTSLAHATLLYKGILWGKRLNCKIFDFEGIYDERFPNPKWIGFSRFKKSFGGYEVTYPGCYTKLRFPW